MLPSVRMPLRYQPRPLAGTLEMICTWAAARHVSRLHQAEMAPALAGKCIPAAQAAHVERGPLGAGVGDKLAIKAGAEVVGQHCKGRWWNLFMGSNAKGWGCRCSSRLRQQCLAAAAPTGAGDGLEGRRGPGAQAVARPPVHLVGNPVEDHAHVSVDTCRRRRGQPANVKLVHNVSVLVTMYLS